MDPPRQQILQQDPDVWRSRLDQSLAWESGRIHHRSRWSRTISISFTKSKSRLGPDTHGPDGGFSLPVSSGWGLDNYDLIFLFLFLFFFL